MTHLGEGRVALETDAVHAMFRTHADEHDLPLHSDGTALQLELWGTWVTARPDGPRRTHLTLRAPDAGLLDVLREAVTGHMETLGTLPDWEGITVGAHPANMRLATVAAVTEVSPRFRRIRLTGDLARFAGEGLHLRLLLPPEGTDTAYDVPVQWPVLDDKGRTRWPEGAAALHRPVYTVRRIGAAGDWLDVDVYLHQGGRTTDWTARTTPGDRIGLMGPGGGGIPQEPHLGLWGDETALPAIARILECLPADTRGSACISVPAADLPDLAHPAGMRLTRVDSGAALLADLAASPLPEDGGFAWIGAEKSDVAHARAALAARGLPRTRSLAAAYWSRDAGM
ncbi:siderophore-interacting protein [Pseudooceanicola aestuarii]|uniref:siderophore-interacting protein n=1 Tax=Pseudooceanicola aestuarii TaxID=2697319 RepID=UPI0013CFF8C6|nr:siderophore-interacting protein [Pseudooceanicola aestuarii]